MNKHVIARIALAVFLALVPAVLSLAACESDEPGHSKTTTKETVTSPSGKTTVTQTHETDTKVYPK